MQPIQNFRQRLYRLRSIASGIVQQNDTAVPALLFNPLNNDVRARSGPVLWINILQHHEITEVLRDLQSGEFSQP